MLKKFKRSNFYTKFSQWEYWPMPVVYAPVFLYGMWCALKARSPFYYAATNPGIENGGMLNDSKYRIYQKLKPGWYPHTLFIPKGDSSDQILDRMKNEHLHFPVIVKPDIGERGLGVEKITNEKELQHYLAHNQADLLVQEFVDMPIELGVFYYRYPDERKGRVSSVVIKDLLKVKGDGKSTIAELIDQNPRARLQWEELKGRLGEVIHRIPQKDEVTELMPIGNHCRGTAFLNGNHLINEQLTEVFDRMSRQIEGFYYGRFDLRCKSLEALYRGEGFQIIELNGTKSEPAHIYQPGYSLLKAYREIFHHWRAMYRISRMNRRAGYPEQQFGEGWKVLRKYMRYDPVKK